MADDPNKISSEQAVRQHGQEPGQESEQRHKDQHDTSKRNPSRQVQDLNEEQDDHQKGDKRRAS